MFSTLVTLQLKWFIVQNMSSYIWFDQYGFPSKMLVDYRHWLHFFFLKWKSFLSNVFDKQLGGIRCFFAFISIFSRNFVPFSCSAKYFWKNFLTNFMRKFRIFGIIPKGLLLRFEGILNCISFEFSEDFFEIAGKCSLYFWRNSWGLCHRVRRDVWR